MASPATAPPGERVSEGLRGATGLPHALQIEATSRCNLKCPNCRRSMEFPDAADSLTRVTLDRLDAVLPHLDKLTVSGFGESLMGRTLEPLLERAGAAGVRVSITTNGTMFTEAKCRELIERGAGHVCVSLDAGTAEGFARLRPGGVPFERVIEGLRRLAAMRDAARSLLPGISVAMLYFDDSARELAPLIDLAATLPISHVTLQVLYFSDFREGSAEYRLSAESVRLLEAGRRLARSKGVRLEVDLSERMARDCGEPGEDGLVAFPAAGEARARRLVPTCRAPWENPYVDARGGVYPCCIYPEPLGDLSEASFEEIWNGKRFRELRAGMREGRPSTACLHCRKTLWYSDFSAPEPDRWLRAGDARLSDWNWNPIERTERGTAYRWSRARSRVWLKGEGEEELVLEARAPAPVRVRVRVDGEAAGEIEVGEDWELHRSALPSRAIGVVRVDLETERPHRHGGAKSRGEWGQLRGVAVAQVGLAARGEAVEPINPRGAWARLKRRFGARGPAASADEGGSHGTRWAQLDIDGLDEADGWGALERDEQGRRWRWSVGGRSRVRFEGAYPAGRYRVHLVLFRPPRPAERTSIVMETEGLVGAGEREIGEGSQTLEVRIAVEEARAGLTIDLNYATWRPADVDPASRDVRAMGFMLIEAWVDREA